MLPPSPAWALEQNDRRLLFAAGAEAALFAESEAFRVTRHRHPVRKVVLPVRGLAWTGQDPGGPATAAGLVVPPELTHVCATTSAYDERRPARPVGGVGRGRRGLRRAGR
ncbi:hypothetical protein AB0L05_11465 [Nonomuraea pusilla]|uniref:hypothetical protein n=1 Tax=Nonomuraea pusilla TaxID=46177 RepID=UPI003326C6E6